MQIIYNGTDLTIDTETWESAIYFARIETKSGTITQKIIKA